MEELTKKVFDKIESESFLSGLKNFYAHLKKDESDKETLTDHSKLVLNYSKKLLEIHKLEPTVTSLLKDVLPDNYKLVEKLLEMFFESINFHDLGKINPNFQAQKMNNSDFKSLELKIGTNHSFPSFVLYLNLKLDEILNDKKLGNAEKLILLFFVFLFGQQIIRHHSPNLHDTYDLIKTKFNFSDEDTKKTIDEILELILPKTQNQKSFFWRTISQVNQKSQNTWISENLKEFKNLLSGKRFSLYVLLKLHYSLLTASDYLATTHYMNGWGDDLLNDFGTIDKKLTSKIVKNSRALVEHNKKIYDELDRFVFKYPEEKSNKNLNQLRQELAVEVIHNIRPNSNKLLFYIEAPTGSGKTNLSFLALAELMSKKPIKNVFYVFPFTNLITQTYKSIRATLGLTEDEVVELHSKTGFPERQSFAKYGKKWQNHIDYLFANYPFALMSHVKFFDILKTNRKEKNYLIHRLANSVVIIDELQSYNPADWDIIIYFIDNYARYFNIRFILMSATLPKLGSMQHVNSEIVYLIKDKNKYFQNPNFKDRVRFDFSLLKWKSHQSKEEKEKYLEKLAKKVLEESKLYQKDNKSVHTIIEFIFKQTTSEFSKEIEKIHNGFFDEIFVLSGTILEFRRKEIISFLKNPNNRSKNVLLISTQVVEAGVDIDMDLGFKDQSIIDSEEQLAGRINRNVKKATCKLYLFKCDKTSVIYGKDWRYRLTQKENLKNYQDILENKKFDTLYNEIMKKLDTNAQRTLVQGLDDYEKKIKALRYQEVNDEFKIINQYSESVFVPISIPVFVPQTNNKERNFSKEDICFLKRFSDDSFDTEVLGEVVFSIYENIVRNKDQDFVMKRVNLRKLQGIMNQFTFSLMANSSISKEAKSFGEERLGFFYLKNYQDCYSPKLGLSIENDSFV